jgi:hypothetical protein
MRTLTLSLTLAALTSACAVSDSTPPIKSDAESPTGGSGGSKKAGGTGGNTSNGAGGSVETSAGGGGAATTGNGGSAGSEGTDAGSGVDDASTGDGSDGRLPIVYCDGGTTYSGMALQLDGTSSYATIPRPVQDDFTLEAWIKTTSSLYGTEFWQGIGLFHADVQGGNNDFGAAILNDTFAFGMGLGPGAADATLQATTPVTTGEWMHVAATRKESTGEVQVFVNGNMEGSQAYTQVSPLSASTTLTIGGNTIDSHYFSGAMDEVRIWNVVRTQAEIQSNMYKKLLGNEPGLIGYYKFDDSSTTAASDTSPSAVSLSLKGQASKATSQAPLCQP